MTVEIPVLKVGDLLLVSIQNELNDRVATALQERVLQRIRESRAAALLIDISSLELVDSYIGRVLTDTARMARLMNTRVSLVGMQPAVAITMTEMGLDLPDVSTSYCVEQGLRSLGYRLERVTPEGPPDGNRDGRQARGRGDARV